MTRFLLAIVAILASIIGALTGVGSGIVLKSYGFYYVHCFHPKTY